MGWNLIIQRRSHLLSGRVAGMLRNGWPEWIGMPGRNGPEQVAGMARNTQEIENYENVRDWKGLSQTDICTITKRKNRVKSKISGTD